MSEQGLIVVTGASAGIGQATALRLGQAGHRVVCAGRRQTELSAVAEAIRASGGTAHAVTADVTSGPDVQRLFSFAQSAGPVRGVVHCAGVLGAIGPLVEADPSEWAEVIRSNLVGAFLVLRSAARAMLAARSPGSIVLLSGGGAGYGFPSYSAYAASKAAVVRLAETAALELAPAGIVVNALAPGFVPTGIHAATLAAGPQRAGESYHAMTRDELRDDSGRRLAAAVDAIVLLLSDRGRRLSGRLVSAVHDDIGQLIGSASALGQDGYRLRRTTTVPAKETP